MKLKLNCRHLKLTQTLLWCFLFCDGFCDGDGIKEDKHPRKMNSNNNIEKSSTESHVCSITEDLISNVVSVNCSQRSIKELNMSLPRETRCQSLDLSYNYLGQIRKESFMYITVLEVLNLTQNRLSSIEAGAFHHLENLEKLDLSFNLLKTITTDLFMKLSGLKYLDISSNQLLYLPNALPMLDLLDVSNNSIEFVEESVYSSVLLPQQVFLIGQNPLSCDCKMLWLKELLDTRKYILKFVKYIPSEKFFPLCERPEKLKGISWQSLEDSEFMCADNPISDAQTVVHYNDETDIGKILVIVKEVGTSFIQLEWTSPTEVLGLSIEIIFHKFGRKDEQQTVILPLEASHYKLKKLQPNAPYVICYKILSGAAVQLHDCLEIKTKKIEITRKVSYFSWKYLQKLVESYGVVFFVTVIILLFSMFFTRNGTKIKAK